MKNPVLALAWQCWRMSRRWYLMVLALTLLVSYKLLSMQPANVPAGIDLKPMLAVNVLMLTFVLALFTTLIAISLGNKKGFPFYFEFRLPVSTSLLVVVPMLCFSLLCASLCFVPLTIYRLVYAIPFPVLSVSIMIMVIVCAQLAGAWAVTRDSVRSVVLLAAWFGFGALLGWFKFFNFPRGRVELDNSTANVMSLSVSEYSIVILIMLALVCSTIFFVAQQRHQGSWRRASDSGKPVSHALSSSLASSAVSSPDSPFAESASGETALTRSRSRFAQVLSFETLACPVSSPWLAEAWVELRRFGSPVLKLSLVAALLIPFLSWLAQGPGREIASWLAQGPGWEIAEAVISLSPVFVFFSGIGIMVLNRRRSSHGFMGSFERSISLSSQQLVLIQTGMTSLLIFFGLLVVASSIALTYWLPLSLPPEVIITFKNRFSFLTNQSAGVTVSDVWVAIISLPASVALFFSLHTCSLIWGRKFSLAVLVLLFGSIIQIFRIRLGSISEESLITTINIMTGIIIVPALLALFRVVQLKLLTAAQTVLVLLVWLSFIPFGLYSLHAHELLDANTDMVRTCFYSSLLLLPLTLSMSALWAYDKLRHR